MMSLQVLTLETVKVTSGDPNLSAEASSYTGSSIVDGIRDVVVGNFRDYINQCMEKIIEIDEQLAGNYPRK